MDVVGSHINHKHLVILHLSWLVLRLVFIFIIFSLLISVGFVSHVVDQVSLLFANGQVPNQNCTTELP